MNTRITCNEILQIINTQIKHSNIHYFCIFDLDDTIFDTSYRRFFIYEEFLRKQYNLPMLSPYLHKNHYNFIPLIENEQAFQDYRSEIMETFFKFFLSNSFLYLDKPFPGVRPFFNSLYKLRIPVIFLTGRLESTMKTGTCDLLEKYGLNSSANEHDYLIMKKDTKIPVIEFKKKELKRIRDVIPESKFVLFDNESENCRSFRKIAPDDTIVVRFNSVQKVNRPYNGLLLNNWA